MIEPQSKPARVLIVGKALNQMIRENMTTAMIHRDNETILNINDRVCRRA